jgi:glycosyltransferase involved in cell wall biosynthesis
MACKCLVLSSPAASLPEVCGEAALFIQDPFDIDSIEEGMKRALSLSQQEKEMFIQKGLQHVSFFSWEKAARQVQELFFSLCLTEKSR